MASYVKRKIIKSENNENNENLAKMKYQRLISSSGMAIMAIMAISKYGVMAAITARNQQRNKSMA
jgi:hypothetical protein